MYGDLIRQRQDGKSGCWTMPSCDSCFSLSTKQFRILGLVAMWLAGFTCDELGLGGGRLPDGPFYNATLGFNLTPVLDIFGFDFLFYNILTCISLTDQPLVHSKNR